MRIDPVLLLVDTNCVGVNPERFYLVVAQRLVGSVSSDVIYIVWGLNLLRLVIVCICLWNLGSASGIT